MKNKKGMCAVPFCKRDSDIICCGVEYCDYHYTEKCRGEQNV